MKEDWKSPPGFSGLYEVNRSGCLRNARTLRILEPIVHSDGSMHYKLSVGGVKKTVMAHQLVWRAFRGVPAGRIKFLDGNRGNVELKNLYV